MEKIVRRAIAETFDEGLWPFVSAGVVGVVTLALQVYFQGWETALSDAVTWLIGGAAVALWLAVVFIYELARAAYLIEHDAHQITKAELEAIKGRSARVSEQETQIRRDSKEFHLWQAACIAAEEPFQRPVPGGMATYHLESMREDFLKSKIEFKMEPQAAYFTRTMHATRSSMGGAPAPEIPDNNQITRKQFIAYLTGRKIKVPEFTT